MSLARTVVVMLGLIVMPGTLCLEVLLRQF